jgi:phage-related baseplate assembly protein
VRAGVDTNALAPNVKTAIAEAINKLKIGEPKQGVSGRDFSISDLIKNAAKNVDPDGILGVVVNSPAADIYATDSQLFRTTVGDITIA